MLQTLRKSPVRRPIIKFLAWLHSTSYHQISFFSSYSGIHPKHAIQNYYRFFLENIESTDKILDIGSGNGVVAAHLADKATYVIGIDIRPQNIEISRRNHQKKNLEFILGDATTYNFNDTFDAIILSNVLEHIEHRVKFLKDIKRLAPKILIRVPMLTRDWITVYKKQEGLEYRLDDTHYIEYTKELFEDEIEKAGLYIKHYHVDFGEIYATVST